MVSRISPQNRDTVDLHGTSIAEATVIVKEILQQEGSSLSSYFSYLLSPDALIVRCVRLAKPLKIITGRGNHSVNRIGVLKPAVRAVLTADGWFVSTWDGGLVVKGKGKTGMYAR